MTTDAAQIATAYFETWKARDFDGFRATLADDATFNGPLGQAANADECVQGIRGMSEHLDDLVIEKMFVDGPDVLTWYEMHMADTPPVTVANWIHVEHGKIASIRVTFDPRPMMS